MTQTLLPVGVLEPFSNRIGLPGWLSPRSTVATARLIQPLSGDTVTLAPHGTIHYNTTDNIFLMYRILSNNTNFESSGNAVNFSLHFLGYFIDPNNFKNFFVFVLKKFDETDRKIANIEYF